MAQSPPIIKDQGCLLSCYLSYSVWFHCSRCFVMLPTGTTVGWHEKCSLNSIDFSKISERNVALMKAICNVFTVPWNCLGRGGISRLHPCFFFRCRVWSPQREHIAEIGRAPSRIVSDPGKGDYNRPTSGSAISEDTTMGVGVRASHESPG